MEKRRFLLRRLAGALLALWLDRDERADVLLDLNELASGVRERRGPTAARLWFVWQLLKYPFYLWRGGAGAPVPKRGPEPPHSLTSPRVRLLAGWIRELRFGLRRCRKRLGASVVVVLTLAMGIGASASVFSVLNTLVLRPLPFREPDRLVRVRENLTVVGGEPPREVSISPRRFEQLRDRSRAFEDVAAARYRTFTLSGEGEPERIIGLTATWNHFTVLGVAPILGRTYGPEEDAPGAPASVAVISHSLWTRRFGRDPAALGSELVVDGRPHTVVGVMPLGFRYPYAGELWIPMGIDPADPVYEDSGLNVNARLAPGATLASARDEMAALSASLSAERPDTDANKAFTFRTLEDEILEGVPRKVSALLWAAVFVLLIGAANVASMILARLHAEEMELNVQVALGAGRRDLMRRFLAEGLVLTAFGLLLGLVISGATVGSLTRLSPVSDLGPYFQEVGIDARVVLFGTGLALGALLLATVPTLVELGRGRHAAILRGQGLGSPKGRWGIGLPDLLVASELAVAVILLTGAGLTIQSVRSEWSQDLGLDPEGLYTFGVAPSASGYGDAEDRIGYMDAVLERIRSVPGVEAAAYTNMNPMRSHGWGASVWPEGRVPRGVDDVFTVNHRAVSPGYFETAGTRLLSGRVFLPSDGPGDPGVTVVSQRAARLLWPGEEPLGKRLRMGGADAQGRLLTVVGVVEDVKEYDYLAETWYRPFRQDPRDYNTRILEIFVRGGGEAGDLLPGVRRAIRDVDPGVPVFNVEAMGDILRFERRVESFATLLLTLFAGIGVALAAVGIYGVLSYSTGRRTREIGLRIALGAGRREVVLDLLARTLRSCALGLGVGVVGAALLSGVIQSLVVDAALFSPSVYLLSALGLCSVAIVAAVGPTLRALRIHPRSALAGE